MSNPFESIRNAFKPKRASLDEAIGAYGTEMNDRVKAGRTAEALDEAKLEQGKLDGHMTTLLRMSPEAYKLIDRFKDEEVASADFNASIQDYNQKHENGAPADEMLDSFTAPVRGGRSINVTLYKSGRVILRGSEESVH